MAPLLRTAGLLLALGLKAVSADFICSANPSPPSGAFCGVIGDINVFDYYQEDLFDAVSTTPEGCAAACFQMAGCLSFYVDPGTFCELQSGTEVQTEFVTDPTSVYAAYDISCFVCTDPSTATTASSTSSTALSSSTATTTSSTSSAVLTTSVVPTPSAVSTTSNISTTLNSTTSYSQTSTIVQNSTTQTTYPSTFNSTALPTTIGSNSTTTKPVSRTSIYYQNSTIGYSSHATSISQPYGSNSISRPHKSKSCSKTSSALPTASVSSSVSQTSISTSAAMVSPSFTTSTVYATSTYTITSCAASITNCPLNSVTTETIAVYTTICPVAEAKTSTVPKITSIPAGYTMSTVYATKIYTITSCAATVTNCPVGKVTTETSSLYTTICPESGSPSNAATKQTGGSSGDLTTSITMATVPEVTSVPAGYSMSTVYATKIYTITSCAATVTNCPVGKVTTEISSLYTTVYPESVASSNVATQDTGAASGAVIAVIATASAPASSAPPQNSTTGFVTWSSAQPSATSTLVYTSVSNLTTSATPSSGPLKSTTNAGEILAVKWSGMMMMAALVALAVL
ncbi:hypothetical protein BP6252_13226 [Coleophoma cylindrospora]|uniref:Apple domain-containing protein n=1 Tax=Coleophoma cylindrospora TaxID=1849047 RepID=A0A3D8QAT1_9HELO|nr:hypothetical protein BP6252_13226 [Coleophoma cylindrospora]